MDTVVITLPVSGKEVVIRNYTTRKDDKLSNAFLFAGVKASQKGGDSSVDFPISNVMASQEAYIPRLVQSVGGDSDVDQALEDLHSKDYDLIEKTVEKIVEENSPKAKEVKKASENATPQK